MVNDKEIQGKEAMQLAREVSKIPDGTFSIAFYQYDRTTGKAIPHLRIEHGCKVRAQLPKDKWEVGGENYFLFTNSKGEPKTCWRILIRFMAFPNDGFKLRKIRWIW